MLARRPSWAITVVLAIAAYGFAEMLRDHSYELWADWALSMWGTIQILGPAAAAWSAVLWHLSRRGSLPDIHMVTARAPEIVRARVICFAVAYSWVALGLCVLASAAAAWMNHSWGRPNGIVVMFAAALIPGYAAVGVLVARVVRGWAAPVVAFAATYITQGIGLYDGEYREALSPVRQLTSGPYTGFDRHSAWLLLGWFAAVSLVLLTVSVTSPSPSRRVIVMGVTNSTLAFMLGYAVMHGPELRVAEPGQEVCLDTESAPKVCVHPSAAAALPEIESAFREAMPRFRILGLGDLRVVRQGPGDLSTPAVPHAREARFALPSPSNEAVSVAVSEVALGSLIGNCKPNAVGRDDRSLMRPVLADWVSTGSWPASGAFLDFPVVEGLVAQLRDQATLDVRRVVAALRGCEDLEDLG